MQVPLVTAVWRCCCNKEEKETNGVIGRSEDQSVAQHILVEGTGIVLLGALSPMG